MFNLCFHWLIIWFKKQTSAPPMSPPSQFSYLPSLHIVYSVSETAWKLLSYLIMDLVAPLQACTIGRYWIPQWDQWENRKTKKERVREGGRETRWRRDGADKNRNPVPSPVCVRGRAKPCRNLLSRHKAAVMSSISKWIMCRGIVIYTSFTFMCSSA